MRKEGTKRQVILAFETLTSHSADRCILGPDICHCITQMLCKYQLLSTEKGEIQLLADGSNLGKAKLTA